MTRLESSGRSPYRVGLIALAVWGAALVSPGILAQAPEKAPGAAGPAGIESDPIKCWWRTDKAAVEVGERFTLALTCAVVETDAVKAVPDTHQLDPTALEITPFEVVGGTRHDDIQAPPWRYFQYEYTVRLLEKGFFGRDIEIPSVSLKYNIVSTGEATEGREQMYVLPALPMRIASLVPAKATDIRDASGQGFGEIEARSRRSGEAFVAAAVSFGFAAVFAGLALGAAFGQFRKREPADARPLPAATLLDACLREIRRVNSDVARNGWTADLVARALAVCRVAGAVALGRPVAQATVDLDAPVREGQVPLRQGILRPKRSLISAATSAGAIERRLAARANGKPSGSRAAAPLEDIGGPLQVFAAARYSRDGALDTTTLDAALENGRKAIRRLRLRSGRTAHLVDSVSKFASGVGVTWSR